MDEDWVFINQNWNTSDSRDLLVNEYEFENRPTHFGIPAFAVSEIQNLEDISKQAPFLLLDGWISLILFFQKFPSPPSGLQAPIYISAELTHWVPEQWSSKIYPSQFHQNRQNPTWTNKMCSVGHIHPGKLSLLHFKKTLADLPKATSPIEMTCHWSFDGSPPWYIADFFSIFHSWAEWNIEMPPATSFSHFLPIQNSWILPVSQWELGGAPFFTNRLLAQGAYLPGLKHHEFPQRTIKLSPHHELQLGTNSIEDAPLISESFKTKKKSDFASIQEFLATYRSCEKTSDGDFINDKEYWQFLNEFASLLG